jgi:hypothetical protein
MTRKSETVHDLLANMSKHTGSLCSYLSQWGHSVGMKLSVRLPFSGRLSPRPHLRLVGEPSSEFTTSHARIRLASALAKDPTTEEVRARPTRRRLVLIGEPD